MHRTFSVPCRIGWWSLLVSVTLHVGIHAASAQNPIQNATYAAGRPEDPQRPAIVMAQGTSQTCAMTTRAELKRVENPNSNVVRVGRVPDKNNEVLLVAERPGRTLVTLTDQTGRVEVHEVVVTGEVLQDVKNVVRVKLEKGDQRSFKLEKVPLGGVRSTNSEILDIKLSLTDAKSFTVVALRAGATRVYFFADKLQQEVVAVYDFEVAPEDSIGQLREFIRTIPTAGVSATPIKLPSPLDKDRRGDRPDNGVVLRGTVTSAFDATAIVAVAKRLFPASITGVQSTTTPGGITTTGDLLRDNVINYIQVGGVQQVNLHVVVAVVNRTRAKNLTFSWVANGNEWFAGSLLGGTTSFASGVATGVFNSLTPTTGSTITPTGSFNVPFGVIHNNNNFFSYLQLLNSEGITKILAEPRVTTLSGKPANIVSGGSTPILTSAGVGAPSVSYQNFGTVVSCLPTVLGNGKILLEVRPEVSSINAANGITITGVTPTAVPGFDVRSAQVTVQLEDGQTLAIGGLIQNKFNNTVTKVPVLGDIPGLQFFFTNKSLSEEEEEMVILVTPRLVDPFDCAKFPKYMPSQETRVPDDFEFFLEGIMEAPRGPRNLVFHPRLYQAAYKNAPNAGQIPCANGNCFGQPGAGCATGNCGGATPTMATPSVPTAPFASPKALATPTVPSVQGTPTSNANKITVEPETPALSPPIREIPPSLVPSVPSLPPVPPAPPRELQNRPVLPPLAPSNYGPNN